MSGPNVLYQITSILSVTGSGLVILTLLLFKSMRSKLFMQIIAYISLADILANIEYTMTYRPSNENWWCSTQGFLNLYGYPCSWLWTAVLMKFLHDLAVRKQVRMSMWTASLICWGLPLITTLLYIAFIPQGTYERPSGSSTDELCSYGGENFEQGFVWHMISYFGMFLACVAYMVYTYTQLRKVYHATEKPVSGNLDRGTIVGGESSQAALQRVRLTSESLLLYPLIMVVLWTPHMVGVTLKLQHHSHGVKVFAFFSTNLKILCGLATAVLFFWKSQAARTQWYRLLCNGVLNTHPNGTADADDGSSSYARSSTGSYFRDSSFAEFSLQDAEDPNIGAGAASTASTRLASSLFGFGRDTNRGESRAASTQNPLDSGSALGDDEL